MRILLVEDNPDLAANIGEFLTLRGHSVDLAFDGDEGFIRASSKQHDVIVLDRMLPGANGVSISMKLRDAGQATPILMLTALNEIGDRVEGLAAGADDYLVKPFAMAELAARVSALHRRSTGATLAPVLRVGDLEYNTGTAEVWREGKLLELRRAERKLLELMLRRSPNLATKSECEQVLWGDEVPEWDLLRTHMHNLRLAVDKPFARKLIHTVRGEGYRIAALGD